MGDQKLNDKVCNGALFLNRAPFFITALCYIKVVHGRRIII